MTAWQRYTEKLRFFVYVCIARTSKRAQYSLEALQYETGVWGKDLAQSSYANTVEKVGGIGFNTAALGAAAVFTGGTHLAGDTPIWVSCLLGLIVLFLMYFGLLRKYLGLKERNGGRVAAMITDGPLRPDLVGTLPVKRLYERSYRMERTNPGTGVSIRYDVTTGHETKLSLSAAVSSRLEKEAPATRETFWALAPESEGTVDELTAAIRLL